MDINQHYLELQVFLAKVEHDPETGMNRYFNVFVSEKRLYGNDKNVNHHLHASYEAVEEKIFSEDETDKCLLYPLLGSGATSMKEKLSSYAQTQLPGGKYWEPDQDVKAILKSLKPNNDICESILGLNDYLSTALPNMHQMTKSNLVQVKKTRQYNGLIHCPVSNKVELARKCRVQVGKACKEAEFERSKLRQEKMIGEKCQRDALVKRAAKEKERLSKLHLITSADELKTTLIIGRENAALPVPPVAPVSAHLSAPGIAVATRENQSSALRALCDGCVWPLYATDLGWSDSSARSS